MLQEKVQNKVEKGAEAVKEIIQDDIWATIRNFLDLGFYLGKGENPIHLTIGGILLVVISFLVASVILRLIRSLITRKMERQDELKFISIFKFIRYLTYLVVILLSLGASGIDITVLITASAALFVGLGLALQELFQDIIGGIFIMLDKSLAVNDIIELNGKVGRIFEIRLRTTRAITRDDKVIIIPNHKFISEVIYNYTQNHNITREAVNVGVAYGCDTALVKKILLDCADKQSGVLKSPAPFVLFEDFGDSALLFGIYFFISDSFVEPRIKSEIRFKIDGEFRKNNISIPFPQRDVHFIKPKL